MPRVLIGDSLDNGDRRLPEERPLISTEIDLGPLTCQVDEEVKVRPRDWTTSTCGKHPLFGGADRKQTE